MKKVLVIIIVLLSLGVIGYGIYYVATHDFSVNRNSDEKKNVELNEGMIEVNKEDSIKLIDTKEVNGSFIQEYEIIINGITKRLEIEFLYRDNSDLMLQSLTGEFSGSTLYAYYEYYGLEGEVNEAVYQDGHPYDINMINSSFNEENFDFIKGEDEKSYLVIHTNIYSDGSGEEDKLYILNETLEFVSNDLVDYEGNSDTLGFTIMSTYTSYTLDEYPWYSDTFNACSVPANCYINVKIEDNKIYYLVPVLSDKKTDNVLEERVYTISDSKLEYEVIKRYNIIEIKGIMGEE